MRYFLLALGLVLTVGCDGNSAFNGVTATGENSVNSGDQNPESGDAIPETDQGTEGSGDVQTELPDVVVEETLDPTPDDEGEEPETP
ncbi:MAG: hypothetical protein HRU19_14485 [Pseudobacteriovorax sp.]|nr:hypothetical protein [Pseudobacteriovorax sp.]